ncbi:hypothetical protein BjapCC829_36960 [Bradyrhizobium barranii]|jgi:hypothetical protein|uniref:Potassium-transporting ATPase subunit F n=1 Tax=Bradyrhizobium barranii TaxID=2992140 RepID=A0ABY3QHJ6_9BRAD|nr:hypothetical protein [Bradyrhizobium japonicum]UFW85454.1 hypothetical protein BjapCC829_36960 [Bradyrhizobium japonicum]
MPVVALQHGQKSRLVPWKCFAFPSFHALAGRRRNGCVRHKAATRSIPMMDILMLALGFGFFALAIGYTYACERL